MVVLLIHFCKSYQVGSLRGSVCVNTCKKDISKRDAIVII